MSRLPSRVASIAVLALLTLFVAPARAPAQGVLININPTEHVILPRPIWIRSRSIPVPQSSYKIKSLDVNVKLSGQVAKVQVSQAFVNTGSMAMEVCFVFPLPYDGAIDQLTLMVDGREMPAKLLPAADARQMYEEIVRKNRDPALLEWMGTGLFKTSVFPVPPGAERKVTLRYSQLCRKTDGLTDFLFPLSTAKYTSSPVDEIKFQVAIDSESEIKNVYSPNHAIEINRPDDKHALVSYSAQNQIPSDDFRLFYDVGQGQVGATVLSYRRNGSEDGYFLMLASPQIKAADAERPKKTVVFVVDRSGSMSGPKIEQARGAAKFVLDNLREGDMFNIIAFDSQVESWKPELQRFNDETRKAARGFIEGIYAGGSTNIDGALETALGQLKDNSRPNFILFLTDGIPTDGEQNESRIVANSRQRNKVHARIFTFGVGYDLNSRLLDKLAGENFGQSEFVRPNEDIEARVSALYRRIGAPVLSDVKINWDLEGLTAENGKPVNRVYPAETHDLFAGEQLVIVGRYKKSGAAKVRVTGKVGDKEQTFDFPANLVEHSGDESLGFVEKLWAIRRVGEILDQLDLKGKNDELVKELVGLSVKHGILTPYTSFMADDTNNFRDYSANSQQAEGRLRALNETDGELGVAQRAAKGAYKSATTPGAAPAYDDSPRFSEDGGGRSDSGAGQGVPDTGGSGFATAPRPKVSASKSAGPGFGFGDRGAGARPSSGEEKNKEAEHVVQNVRNVGSKTFYRRGNQWIDSAVTEEQQKKPIKIERYSDEYFKLVDRLGRDAARYMTFDEPVVIELEGKVYAF